MAVSVSSNQGYKYNQLYLAITNNGGYTPYYTSWYGKYTYRVDKLPESRIRPADPLWLQPTAYPQVSLLETNPGHKFKIVSNEQCGYISYPIWGCWTNKYEYYEQVMVLSSAVSWPNLSTNWQLPIRLQIKRKTLNLGETLAEFNRTADLFYDTASLLWDIYRASRFKFSKKYRRKHRKKKLRKFSTSDISDSWLALNFGALPAISDLVEAYGIQRARAILGDIWHSAYVRLKDTDRVVQSQETTDGLITDIEYTLNEQVKVYYKIHLPDHINVGNPLELGYNLIPFSFVVDWMFNLGDILSSLDALSHVSDLIGTKCIKKTIRGVTPKFQIDVNGYTVDTEETYIFDSFEREVISIGDIPQSDLIPSYQPSTALKSVLNGLALLHKMRR